MSTPAEQGNNQEAQPSAEDLWAQVAAERNSPSDDTPTPPAVEQPNEPVVPTTPTTPAAPAAPAPAPVDPYEGLSPAVRDKLAQLDTMAASLRTAHTHIGNIMQQNKSLVEQVAAAKKAIPANAPAPTTAQVAEASKSYAKFEQLKKDFPELADALEERFGATVAPAPDLNALRSQIQEELEGQLTTKITTEVRAKLEAETESRLVNAAHRNWTDLVKTDDFVKWQQAQPPEIQALGASPRAEDAMQMLDLFKAQQAATTPRVDPEKVIADRQARLKDAAALVRGHGAMAPVKSPDDMTAEELWAFEAAERRRKTAQR